MEEKTVVVYASDNEEDVLKVRDLLEQGRIACTVIMRSDNYLYGPGILNDGLPLFPGRYVIRVDSKDEERCLTLLEDGQLPTVTDAPERPEAPLPPTEKQETSAARPAKLLESIVFAAVYVVAGFVIIEALYFAGFRFRLRATVQIFVLIASFFIVAAVIKQRLHRPAMDMATLVPAPLGTYALTILGYGGIFLLLSPIDQFLAQAFPFYERSLQIVQRLYISSDVVGTLLRTAFVVPVLEETLFRGVIFAGLARNYRLPTALVVSSLIFALCHHNPAQFIGPLLSGLLFAAAYQRSSSLLPCFLGHALNNFVWFLSSFYRSVTNSERSLFHIDPSFDVPRIILGILLLALSVALLLRSKEKKDNGSSENGSVAQESSAT